MKPYRLLYVEDNPLDVDLMLTHFEEYAPEFEIVIVNTGQRCIDRIKESTFDLLLLDYRLPDMDGLEVMRCLAQIGAQLPIVLLTGSGDAPLVSKALRLGAVNYVSKNNRNYLETLPELLTGALKAFKVKQALTVPTVRRKILYVEHLTMDIELTLTHFAESAPHFAVDVVQTCTLALERLSQPHDYELMLIDLRMPDQCGLDLVREVNRRQLKMPPFLVISGQDSDTFALDAIKLGAVDYLCKYPGYLNQLSIRIDCALAGHQVDLLNAELLAELSIRKQTEETLRNYQSELELQNEELHQAQLELDAVRERYFDLFNRAPVSYCTINMQGLILQANLVATTLLGVYPHDLVNRHITSFIFTQDQDMYYLFSKKIFASSQPGTCELRMVKPDGAQFWVYLTASRALNESGIPELRLMLKDITQRKQAEIEQRIAAIAFETQTGMVITDANAVILRINKAFTKLTGYTEEDALGQTPHILSSGQHDQLFFKAMWTSLINDGYWEGKIWNRHKNGNIVVECLAISSVTDIYGKPSHYVGSFTHIIHDIDALEEIHRLAYYDPLTKLPNRRLLQDRLGQAIAMSTRNRLYGAVMFLDLDHFKIINDTRGHAAGDLLLIEVARRLRSLIREVDTLARLGGDEFVVLLEDLDENIEVAATRVKQVAEKILEVLAEPYHIHCNEQSHEFHCSASIGIGLYLDESTPEELLGHADLAMYEAKSKGRNGLCFFDMIMQEVVTLRTSLEQDLRQALAHQEFKLYFQMQALHNGEILGAEVLLRWAHPERGLVSPMTFIPLAEQTGLIMPIGLWVLEIACAQLKTWETVPIACHFQLSVNVSAFQFHQTCFVEQVCEVLERHAIQPGRLTLELTEGLVLNDIESTVAKMQALKEIGVMFSMDDFGTGFSSLSYLTKLPFNQLKIDQSFVHNVNVKPCDATIVQTIINMADNLGMEVIAEGVETEEQRVFLELNRCPAIQGYLLGRPVPLEEFELQVLQKHSHICKY